MANAAAKAMATPCLVLLLILQSCHVLHAKNIDPGKLSGARVSISSQWFKGYYLYLDCSQRNVTLKAGSPPDPQRSRFQFTPIDGLPLSYNIRSATCPQYYIRMEATGGDPFKELYNGFGSVSVTQNGSEPAARFRPVPQLTRSVPRKQGFYALLSDDVGYAYLRTSLSSILNAQNYIGPWEQLNIEEFLV